MGKGKGHSSLKGFSFREITEVLANEGFYPLHKNSTHMVFANAERFFVTVPCAKKKEVNHMMTTVSLQRIKNNQCMRMTEDDYIKLKAY